MGLFVGDQRQQIVESLVDATSAPAGPRLFTIAGPLGSGKSRIIQELFARLAAQQVVPAYWPSAIVTEDRSGDDPGLARKRVAPSKFAIPPDAEIPFLWWGISCERRQSGGHSAPLLQDAEQLYQHAWAIQARWGRRRKLADAVTDPGARDNALKIAGLLATLAGPLGIPVSLATYVSHGLTVRDANELLRNGRQAIANWRRTPARDSESRDLDVEAAANQKQVDVADDLATMLSGAVSGRPSLLTIVAVDDAQWADDGVLHLVRRILEHPDAPIIVVSTAWPEDLERQRAGATPTGLAAIIEDFGPERCETLALSSLEASDLGAIVRELGPDTEEVVATALSDRADGNPLTLRLLLAQQMVRYAVTGGRIDLTVADVSMLPSRIEELHRQLWAELPDDLRRTLAIGACTGDGLVTPVVAATALSLEVDGPERRLQEAATHHGWIRAIEDDLYEFTEESRRTIAADPGNLSARQREQAQSVALERSLELVRGGWTGSPAARRQLTFSVVSLTEQGHNTDLGGAHAAAVQLADILRQANDLVEERRVLEHAMAWGSRAGPDVSADSRLNATVRLSRVCGYLGDTASRDRLRTEAHTLALQIANERPSDAVALDELGESHVRMGDSAYQAGDLTTAEHHFTEAEEVTRRALSLAPERPSTLTSLYFVCDRLGRTAQAYRRPDEALTWYQSALEFARQAAAATPHDRDAAREWARAQSSVGKAALQLGRQDLAESSFFAARSPLEQLVAEDPNDDWSQRNLADVHSSLSRLEHARGNDAAARNHLETCLRLRTDVLAARPNAPALVLELAQTRRLLGDRVALDDPTAARAHYMQGLQLLVGLPPRDERSQAEAIELSNRVGQNYLKASMAEDARLQFSRSLDLAEQFLETQPGAVGVLRQAGFAHEHLGDLHRDAGRPHEALQSFRAAAQARDKVHRALPHNMSDQVALAIVLRKLGRAAHWTKELDLAVHALRASAGLTERTLVRDPSDKGALIALASTISELAKVARKQGNPQLARDYFAKELQIWQRLVSSDPSDPSPRRRLAKCHDQIGDVELRLGDGKAALRAYEEALHVRASLAKEFSDHPWSFREMGSILEKLANTAHVLGEDDLAKDYLRMALESAERLACLPEQSEEASRISSQLKERLAQLN